LPKDVSSQVKTESDGWGSDGHSHSWFTLAELEAYDWEGQSTKHRGWVNQIEFERFDKEGKPQSWSGGVSGSEVVHVSNEEMRARVKQKNAGFKPMDHGEFAEDSSQAIQTLTAQKSYYTKVEWSETYAQSVPDFLLKTMPKLRELANGDPESVRIVFWFDN
jgi:hypothetical protein